VFGVLRSLGGSFWSRFFVRAGADPSVTGIPDRIGLGLGLGLVSVIGLG
jgi:hypothetical protein